MTAPTNVTVREGSKLRGALSNPKMTMIAIGGVIGAGLFVGSGNAIQMAGPAAIVAYFAVGIIVILVMRMLAEMAVAEPTSGSFSTYAGKYLGKWAGTTVGWLYAYQWCVTIGFEAVVGAGLLHQFIPGLPTWFGALILMAALIGVNMTRVESFGTLEYWFAMIKVAAIVAFLAIGVIAICGWIPGVEAPGLDNLAHRGGFAPNGWGAVITASLVVFFSFFGTEVVTIAAGEAKDPVRAVRKGINSVVWRILLFYVGSILVVVTLMPWDSTAVGESPYAAVLGLLHVPAGGMIMNFIVLTAVLSCLNSGIYTASRMIFSLGRQGDGPKVLTKTSRSGTPGVAVLLASTIGLLTVVANYFLPTDAIYAFLIGSSGSIAVVVYILITVTHLVARRRLTARHPEGLKVRMWAYPYLDIAVLIALAAVVGGMAFEGSTSESLWLTILVTAVAVVLSLWHQYRSKAAMRRMRNTAESALATAEP